MIADASTCAQRVEECQGLVRTMAQQVYSKVPANVDLDDLIAYGQVGLIEAARDFDAARGSRFATFAYYRIRGAIYDGLSRLCGMSRGRYRQVRYQQMAGEVLADNAAQAPPACGESRDDGLSHVRDLGRNLAVASLITSARTCDPAKLASQSEDRGGAPPEIAIDNELNQILGRLIDALPQQECELIRAAYFEDLTLQEAGQRLGISKPWASRLHARALRRLARSLKALDLVS